MSNVASTLLAFLATMLLVSATMLPKPATMSNEILSFRQSRKFGTNWTCSICFDFVERTKFRSTSLPIPATLLPITATMSKQHSTLSKGRNYTIESFDIVAVCDNKVEGCFDKVERCFDNVAGVDGALRLVYIASTQLYWTSQFSSIQFKHGCVNWLFASTQRMLGHTYVWHWQWKCQYFDFVKDLIKKTGETDIEHFKDVSDSQTTIIGPHWRACQNPYIRYSSQLFVCVFFICLA